MSQTSVQDDNDLLVPWIAFCSGDTPTAEYQAFASIGTGRDDALVREVTRLCQAFHCETEAPPADRPVLLFWRAKTGDWVITRVMHATERGGGRAALDYYSLLLSDDEFRKLRHNPFLALRIGLHDRVKRQFREGNLEPIREAPPTGWTRVLAGDAERERFEKLEPGGEFPATEENLRALEDFYDHREARGGAARAHAPRTFATWWPAARPVPAQHFDIVLRAPAAQTLSPDEAVKMAHALAIDLKTTLAGLLGDDAGARALFDQIVGSADGVAKLVRTAHELADKEPRESWVARIQDASAEARTVESGLQAFIAMQGERLAAADAARLGDLGSQYEALAGRLMRLKFPNPFTGPSRVGKGSDPNITLTLPAMNAPEEGASWRAPQHAGSASRTGMPRTLLAIPILLVLVAGIAWTAQRMGFLFSPVDNRFVSDVGAVARDMAAKKAENRARDAVLDQASTPSEAEKIATQIENRVINEVQKEVPPLAVEEVLKRRVNGTVSAATRKAAADRAWIDAQAGAQKGARNGAKIGRNVLAGKIKDHRRTDAGRLGGPAPRPKAARPAVAATPNRRTVKPPAKRPAGSDRAGARAAGAEAAGRTATVGETAASKQATEVKGTASATPRKDPVGSKDPMADAETAQVYNAVKDRETTAARNQAKRTQMTGGQ